MTESQVIINKETCLMCGDILDDFNITLNTITKFSQKPIFEYFGKELLFMLLF
jgi:hypothetical protein